MYDEPPEGNFPDTFKSYVFYSANDTSKESTILLFILGCLVEDFGPRFLYDSFLKILNPVFVFSAAHDVLLLLLQLRG